jgi:hypothetical protein
VTSGPNRTAASENVKSLAMVFRESIDYQENFKTGVK